MFCSVCSGYWKSVKFPLEICFLWKNWKTGYTGPTFPQQQQHCRAGQQPALPGEAPSTGSWPLPLASAHLIGSLLPGSWVFWPLFWRFFNSSQTFYFLSWSLSKSFTHNRQTWFSCLENLIKLLLQNTLERTLRGLRELTSLPMGYEKVKDEAKRWGFA